MSMLLQQIRRATYSRRGKAAALTPPQTFSRFYSTNNRALGPEKEETSMKFWGMKSKLKKLVGKTMGYVKNENEKRRELCAGVQEAELNLEEIMFFTRCRFQAGTVGLLKVIAGGMALYGFQYAAIFEAQNEAARANFAVIQYSIEEAKMAAEEHILGIEARIVAKVDEASAKVDALATKK